MNILMEGVRGGGFFNCFPVLVDSSVQCQPSGFLLLCRSVLQMPERQQWPAAFDEANLLFLLAQCLLNQMCHLSPTRDNNTTKYPVKNAMNELC